MILKVISSNFVLTSFVIFYPFPIHCFIRSSVILSVDSRHKNLNIKTYTLTQNNVNRHSFRLIFSTRNQIETPLKNQPPIQQLLSQHSLHYYLLKMILPT